MEALASFRNNPGLKYLSELSQGSFGALWLARVVTGSEVGRLVAVRRLSLDRLEAANVGRALAAVQSYSVLSHPSLAKILGGHKTETDLVLIEEHVLGLPLNKLQDLALARQTSVPIGVSVKLILDALRAAVALRRGCSNQNLSIPARTLFPDSVVVANFGEALLSGVGVMEQLARCQSIREHPEMSDVLDPFEPGTNNGKAELFEVFTAGAMLWKLLVIRSLFNNYGNQKTLNLVLHSDVLSTEYSERLSLCVPRPLVAIIRRATQCNHGLRYQSLQEMISELEILPAELLATDAQVRMWFESVVGDVLTGLQHSSGMRRIPLGSQPTSPVSPALHRISHIDTLLPGGMRSPVARQVPPFIPTPGRYSQEKPTAETTPPDSRPAVAIPSGSLEPLAPRRRIRAAYVIGTFMGLGLSLGLSLLGAQLNSGPTSTASTLAPAQKPNKNHNLSPGTQVEPAAEADTFPDSGVANATRHSANSAHGKVRTTQGARRDQTSISAAPAGTNANIAPVPSNRNRWGI
jgi:hypothetical protein